MGRSGTTFTRRLVKLDGQSRLDLLSQDRYWANMHGTITRLDRMTPDHRENLYHYLRNNAHRLHACAERQLEEVWADAAGDAPTLAGVAPLDWIENCPLMKRLAQLIAEDSSPAATDA